MESSLKYIYIKNTTNLDCRVRQFNLYFYLLGGDLSHERKNSYILSMKYWLFNRDPYNGLL